MKYAVWFVRLVFAAWMIPAGLNHFVPLFPQPMGLQPLSHELIVALIDSHLFDIVKAVELLAGIGVLTGFFAPLALLACMPVSFCVFWWDAPLEGWGSRAALFGYSTLFCNLVLCISFIKSYRTMFAVRMNSARLVLAGRLLLGVWMLANGINHFFLSAWVWPTGHEPLAAQLMSAFVHSGLFDVAMAIQLAAGALLLTGLLVPFALCVLMPVSTCALYWALILEHQPLGAALAVAVFALNGLLMLACLDRYKGSLQKRAVTLGEMAGARTLFDTLFANPQGLTSRSHFIAALVTLFAAVAFLAWYVQNLTGRFCLLVLLLPALILHARRLRDMGRSVWLLLAPVVPMVAAFVIWLGYASLGTDLDVTIPMIAVAAGAGFALWGCAARGAT